MISQPSLIDLQRAGDLGLPGMVGVHVAEVVAGHVKAELNVEARHLAPNGYLHAAAIVALADTAAGYGCLLNLPAGSTGFATIEMKLNFLRTTLSGSLRCEAALIHGGRTTQVWDAAVTDDAGALLALFRCSQLLLYPKGAGPEPAKEVAV